MSVEMLTRVRRTLWKENDLLVVNADVSGLLSGRGYYHESFEIPDLEVLDQGTLREVLTAVVLASAALSKSESWGWSITLPGSPTGVFVGVEPQGKICFRERTADEALALVAVQRQRGGEPLKESKYLPDEGGYHEAILRYFSQVEQVSTRVAFDGERASLVQALPGGRFSVVEEMEDKVLVDLCYGMVLRGEVQKLDERVFHYGCTCSDERVLNMLLSLPEDRRKEVWGDLPQLEVECPRCGRTFYVKRAGVKRS